MDQRIVEILMYVIGEIQSRKIEIDEIDGIQDDLVLKGFSQREVATAISLFTSRLTLDRDQRQASRPVNEYAHRVLHEVEKLFISPEAHGYILQLVHLRLISFSDLELLVERCVLMGNLSIGIDEMKMLVATYLLENDVNQTDPSLAVNSLRPVPDHIH